MKSPIIISVDGNIGSGKSTLFENLKTIYKDNNEIGFAEEPVNEWANIVDENNVNILENLYKDSKKYSFRFQMMAYISRLSLLKKMIEKNQYSIIFTERSVYTDKEIFAKKLFDDGFIEKDEYTIYNMWFHEFLKDISLYSVIYVNVEPEICLQRIIKRNRKGENISLEYLQSLHKYHEEWLNKETKDKFNIVKIDANLDTDLKEHESKKTEWANFVVEHVNLILSKSDRYILQFDGACRGSQSNQCGIGAILYKNNQVVDKYSNGIIYNEATNNVAEYLAFIEGCKLCIKHNINNLEIQGDSMLILNQLGDKYKVKSENLISLHKEGKKLLENFKDYKLIHIKREFNSFADSLANQGLDQLKRHEIEL